MMNPKMLFTAPFMRKYGIQFLPVDPQTMDIEGEFIQELTDSLKAGYDANRPILIAKCDSDDRIDGCPFDGCHRLYVLAKLKEQGIALPNPFPHIISGILDDYMGAPKPANKQKKKNRPIVGLPESVKEPWDGSSNSVYAGKDERFDKKYSYHSCPDCKILLKTATDLQGKVIKVERAPTIEK